jgi:hypothetical protein
MTDPNPDFTPEDMVLWALDMAKDSAQQMTQEDRLVVIRSVVKAFVENGVIEDLDVDSQDGSFKAAAQMLYTCGLVTMVFAQAYNHTEDHLKNIEQLRRSFDL